MKIFNKFYDRIMAEVADETDSAPGGDEAPKTPTPPSPTASVLSDPAVQSAIADAIAETNRKRDEAEAGLKQNKDEILLELKSARQKVVDLEHTRRIQDGDVSGVTKEIESRLKSEYEDQLKETKVELANLQKTIYDNTINSALDAHLEDLKVRSTFRKALKAQLLTEKKVELSKDTGKLLVNEEPSETFFKDWATSDDSRDWISASPSSGGGGLGSGSTGSSKTKVTDLVGMQGSQMIEKAIEIQANSKK